MTDRDSEQIRSCAATCAAANTRRADRAVTRLYAGFLASSGLEPTQYSLLIGCALADGATVSRLAEVFAMDRSALARNLAVMEKRQLLKVKPGEDRRTRIVTLTPFGRSTLANALPRWREAQDTVERKFGVERLRRLLSELHALVEATK